MKRKVHPLTGILLVAIVLVLIALNWASRDRQSSSTTSGIGNQPVQVVTTPEEAPKPDPTLGVVWKVQPGVGRRGGLRVTDLLNDPVPSRLGLAGVMAGDSLFGVEGKENRLVVGINESLDDMITKHKPFTLIIERGRQRIKLPVKSLGKKKVLTTAEIVKLTGGDPRETYGAGGQAPAKAGGPAGRRAR